jgi:hypothetical protein
MKNEGFVVTQKLTSSRGSSTTAFALRGVPPHSTFFMRQNIEKYFLSFFSFF